VSRYRTISLTLFFISLIYAGGANSSDLRWDKVYQVPNNEIWQVAWRSPYTSNEIRPGYDLKIMSGDYSIPNFKWVQVIEENAVNEVHFIATSSANEAVIELKGGAVFKVANDSLDFSLKSIEPPPITLKGVEVLSSISIYQLILIASFGLNGLIGWLIGRYVGKPGLGIVLGLPLGPIGWVVLLLLPRGTKQTRSMDTPEPENPSIPFEIYKREQKKTRPGFAHMTTKEQKQEWINHLSELTGRNAAPIKTETNTVRQEKSEPQSKIEVEPVAQNSLDTIDITIEQRLGTVKDLLAGGLITEEEAATKRSEILKDL